MRPSNNCQFIGRTTAEPKAIGSGDNQGASFTIAVDRPPTKDANGNKVVDQNGNAVCETDFIRCVSWGKRATHYLKNLYKGRLVAVTGELRITNRTNEDGTKTWFTDIRTDDVKFLEWKRQGQSEAPAQQEAAAPAGAGTAPGQEDPF